MSYEPSFIPLKRAPDYCGAGCGGVIRTGRREAPPKWLLNSFMSLVLVEEKLGKIRRFDLNVWFAAAYPAIIALWQVTMSTSQSDSQRHRQKR